MMHALALGNKHRIFLEYLFRFLNGASFTLLCATNPLLSLEITTERKQLD